MTLLNKILLTCILVSWFCIGLTYIAIGNTPIVERACFVGEVFTYISVCYFIIRSVWEFK